MMRFCLFDFFEENTVEIGPTSYIVTDNEQNLNNTDWDFETEVIVNWPTGKHLSSQYVARIVCFAESRLDERLLRERDRLTGKQTAATKGKRPFMKPHRLRDAEDDIGSSKAPPPKKVKKLPAQPGKYLLEKLMKRKELEKREASTNELEVLKQKIKVLERENKDLQQELDKCSKEKSGLKSLEALLTEIPGLLQQVRDLRKEPTPQNKTLTGPQHLAERVAFKITDQVRLSKNPKRLLQDLMAQTFSRFEMASHSLTGGKSNANGCIPTRPQLDRQKMEHLFEKVRQECPGVELKTLREAARNKLSNERKLLSKENRMSQP